MRKATIKMALGIFDSLTKLANFLIETKELNHLYPNCPSEENPTLSSNFAGVKTRDEALKLLQFGDNQQVETMRMKLANKTYKKVEKVILAPSGFKVNVPAYNIGLPYCMFKSLEDFQKTKTKILNLYIDQGVPWFVDKEEMLNAGIEICKVIKALEMQGYRINLYSGVMSYTRQWDRSTALVDGLMVKLKSSSNSLVLNKVTFPICNPAFLRSIFFEWMGKEQGISYLGDGYGSPLALSNVDSKDIESELKKITGKDIFYLPLVNFLNKDALKIKEYIELKQN